VAKGGARRASRRLKTVGLVLLGFYLLAWVGLGIFEMTFIANDGIAIIVVSALFLGELAALGWRHPCAAGVLLICPGAFPIGFGAALVSLGFDVQVVSTLDLGHAARLTVVYGFFVAAPACIGLLLIVSGVIGRWNLAGSRGERPERPSDRRGLRARASGREREPNSSNSLNDNRG
jgi:hypothetical protein